MLFLLENDIYIHAHKENLIFKYKYKISKLYPTPRSLKKNLKFYTSTNNKRQLFSFI